MPRTPKLRLSFAADIGYFARLQQAIERDPNLSSEDKQAMLEHVVALSQLFMRADARRIGLR